MSRLAAIEDAFTAVAEPNRRRILDLLLKGERSVGDIVRVIQISQPLASKHLRVLRDVHLVNVRSDSRLRYYSINAAGLKPIHTWTGSFDQFWNESFDRLTVYLHQLQSPRLPDDQ
jgi:DNA-binding transcriptional ArsR family regulator